LPIKFAATIEEALGHRPECPANLQGMEALPKRVLEMDADVQAVKALIRQVCDAQ
jgi:threonine synthase